jgi:hypothetical protein
MSNKEIADSELLAHYIHEESKFKGDGVNHRLFLPSPKTRNKSVSRIDGLKDDEILEHGKEHVGKPQGDRPILGWAELKAQIVRGQGLSLRADEPPPRHALIETWPDQPERVRSIAIELAARVTAKRAKQDTRS